MSIELSRIRAIFFDVDGTLRDTDDQLIQKVGEWLAPVSRLFPHQNPLPYARRLIMSLEDPGTALLELSDRIGLDIVLEKLGNLAYQMGIGARPQYYMPVPGIVQTLRLLVLRYPLAVISARGQRETLAFLDQHNLTPLFKCIASGQTCRCTKPNPDPLFWAADQIGVKPDQCLMIGDTTADIRAGKSAGAQTVGVLSGFGDSAELQRAGADMILPSVNALPATLLTPIDSILMPR